VVVTTLVEHSGIEPLTSWVRFRFEPLSGVAVARSESNMIPAQLPHSARPRYHPSHSTSGQFQRVPWTNPWTRTCVSVPPPVPSCEKQNCWHGRVEETEAQASVSFQWATSAELVNIDAFLPRVVSKFE